MTKPDKDLSGLQIAYVNLADFQCPSSFHMPSPLRTNNEKHQSFAHFHLWKQTNKLGPCYLFWSVTTSTACSHSTAFCKSILYVCSVQLHVFISLYRPHLHSNLTIRWFQLFLIWSLWSNHYFNRFCLFFAIFAVFLIWSLWSNHWSNRFHLFLLPQITQWVDFACNVHNA